MDNSKEFQLMLDKAIESEPSAFEGFDRTKNVQDQLQEMVAHLGSGITTKGFFVVGILENAFNNFCNKDYNNQGVVAGLQFGSMEQLWLAFVMFELYRKRWDGEGWEDP